MNSCPTNYKMKTVFQTIAWSLLFICVFCIGCEQQAVTETAVETPQAQPEEPKAPIVTEPETAAPEAPVVVEPKPAEPEAPVVVEPKPAEPAAPAETTAEPADSDVAVTVNGIDILESKVAERIKPRLDRLTSQGATLPDAYVQRIKQQTVEGMIVESLMDQKIKEADITVTDEDVIEHLEKSGASQQPPITLDDIKTIIESQGQTFEEVKDNIKKGLTYQKFMETQFADELDVTEEDAQKYYSENTARFKVPEQVNASHILIKIDTSDPNADPNDTSAAAKAKAQGLLDQIKAGADFAEIAKANSDGPTAPRGGELGLSQRGSWVKPFENAAFGLEVGQVSEVVQTQYGYHIIKVTDHQDPNTTSFEQAKEKIIDWLISRKQNDLTKGYIETLKTTADIVYPPGKEPKPEPMPSAPPRMIRPPAPATKPKP